MRSATLALCVGALCAAPVVPAALGQDYRFSPIGTPGSTTSFIQRLGAPGRALGILFPSDAPPESFLWSEGRTIGLGSGIAASDANGSDQVTGSFLTANGEQHAVLWQNGTRTDLGTLGGSSRSVGDFINESGQVIGRSFDASGRYRSFFWANGVMTDLGHLGSGQTSVLGFNNAGQAIGQASTSTFQNRAFIWQNGAMTDLGTLGGSQTQVVGLNDAGRVVANSWTAGDAQVRAAVWENGVLTDLGSLAGSWGHSFATAMNASGTVVGSSDIATGGTHAFAWIGGTMIDLGALGDSSYAQAINDAGQIAGYTDTPEGHDRVFFWESGVMTDIGTLGGDQSFMDGMNELGQIWGSSFLADGTQLEFVWDEAHGMRALMDLLPADLRGLWSDLSIFGIDDMGNIFGRGVFDGQQQAFVFSLSAIPLPTPALLAAGGLLAVGLRRRRAL